MPVRWRTAYSRGGFVTGGTWLDSSFHGMVSSQSPTQDILMLRFTDTLPGWPVALLRAYLGLLFIPAGWGKVTAGGDWVMRMPNFLLGHVEDMSGWYHAAIEAVVVPHAALFAYLVAWGELLIGVALLIGAFSRLAAALGAFMVLNFLWAKGLPLFMTMNHDALVIWLFVLVALTGAGRVWGLDGWLRQRFARPWADRLLW